MVKKQLIYTIIIALVIVGNLKSHTSNTSQDITVIGAGLAGLTAAFDLYNDGFTNIAVYEARERVGGRVFSVRFEGQDGAITYGELGGENILDGGTADNIRALISQLQLETVEGTIVKPRSVYDDNGILVDPYTHLEKYGWTPENLWQQLEQLRQTAHSMEEVLTALFADDQLLFSFFSTRLSCFEGGHPRMLAPRYCTTLYYMILGGLCSVHQDSTAIKYCYIKGGNNLIAQRMAAPLAGHVHLGQPLTAITKTATGRYRLTFATGHVTETDKVVLAIPTTVYGDITFGPDVIPQDKLEAMRAIAYGEHAKILLPTATLGSRRSYCNAYMVAWFGQKNYITMFYPSEQGFFTPATIGDVFNRDYPAVRSAFQLPESCAPSIARDCFMQTYTGPIGHSWHNDPYSKGAYSYIAVGQEEILTAVQDYIGQQVRTLFAPIDDSLFFAGEHTTTLLDVLGTMEAAVQSGKNAACCVQASCQK